MNTIDRKSLEAVCQAIGIASGSLKDAAGLRLAAPPIRYDLLEMAAINAINTVFGTNMYIRPADVQLLTFDASRRV